MTNPSTPIIEHHTALVKLSEFSDSQDNLKNLADSLVDNFKLTVLKKVFYSFKPQGNTLVYILSESHLAIHTWPEYKIFHIDLVSCVKILNFEKSLKQILMDYRVINLKVNSNIES